MFSIWDIGEQFYDAIVEVDNVSPIVFWLVFAGLPILVGVSAVLSGFRVHSSLLTLIIPSMTLFVGFSINSVILLLRYSENSDASKNLIDQVRNLAIYVVVVGIILVVITFAGFTFINGVGNSIIPAPITIRGVDLLATPDLQALGAFGSIIVYSLLAHFLMTILLLPARVYVIVERAGKTR